MGIRFVGVKKKEIVIKLWVKQKFNFWFLKFLFKNCNINNDDKHNYFNQETLINLIWLYKSVNLFLDAFQFRSLLKG